MKRRLFQLILILLFFGVLSSIMSYSTLAALAEVQIQSDQINVGDRVQFAIAISGTTSAKQPEINQIDGLQIDYLGPSTSIQVVNGKMSSSITHNFILTAIKPGNYTLGPFQLFDGSTKIDTNAIKITVNRNTTPNKTPPTGNTSNSDDSVQADSQLFFKFVVPKTKMYIGEQIPITFRLYVGDIRTGGSIDSIVFGQSQVLLEQLKKTDQQHQIIDGQPFDIVEISGILSPVKTGTFTLGPAKLSLPVMVKKRGSMIDDFFDDGYIKRNVQLNSKNTMNVTILPLPAGQPKGFSGGIGHFQMSTSAGTTEVLQGDPISVKITISSSNNLSTISPPYLSDAKGFKVYDAQRKASAKNSNGTVGFEQVVIPLDPKVKQISPLVFSYFDPDSGTYREARTAPIPILVKANPNFNAATVISSSNNNSDEQLGQDLIYIKDNPGQLQFKVKPLYKRLWFLLLQLLPIIALIGSLIYRRKQTLLLADTPESRALRATNKAGKRLATSKELKVSEKFEELLDELHLTIRHYLGEKFNLAAASMTIKVVDILETKGLPPEILQEIRTFFERYDYYRFTGTKLNPTTAQELWDLVEKIIIALENQKKLKAKSKAKPGETIISRSETNGKN